LIQRENSAGIINLRRTH